MSELEQFIATINHKSHEELLFYASFTPEIENKIRKRFSLDENENLRDFFGMYNPTHVEPIPPKNLKAFDFSKYYEDVEKPEGSFISELGVLNIPGSMFHFTRYISPLRKAESVEELKDFCYPNIDGYTMDHMEKQVKNAHSKGKVTLCPITQLYEDAWQIRGYEEFLMDMIENPEMCEYILDRITEKNIKKAQAAARAGVDCLFTGDDVANQLTLMFSIDLWRKFIKSRWEKTYAAARKIKPDIQIWYHSDGNINEIIPELIEIGVTILNPIQPECIDPVEIKKKYGDKIALDGSIGTQTVMPFGTPEDVRRTVKEMKEKLGYDGAFIISPTHVLEPEVPLENILAFIEECMK